MGWGGGARTDRACTETALSAGEGIKVEGTKWGVRGRRPR
jgi:hypothetical protein